MGQHSSSEQIVIPDHVLSQEEFARLVSNKSTFRPLHNCMVKNNKYIKIFICNKETDEDRLDSDYLDNCECDDVCGDYVNQYYIAELKTKRTSCHPAVGNMIWDGYHGEWSYGFDIYEYHKLDPNYKKLFLSDYYFCDVDERMGCYGSIHMAHDLHTILGMIKSLDRDAIEGKMLEILNEQSRLKAIEKINKAYGYKEPSKKNTNEDWARYMESVLVD